MILESDECHLTVTVIQNLIFLNEYLAIPVLFKASRIIYIILTDTEVVNLFSLQLRSYIQIPA